MVDVDLAALADGYQHRPASPVSLQRAADAGLALAERSVILDAGGGPGHHASVWFEQGHYPVVLDPALEMIQPAVERDLPVVLGVSQAMPFRDHTFDLVWFHLSLHYGDWTASVDEAVRVAKEDGRIEIWTLSADHHEESLLSRWFPSVVAIDEARFPDGAEIEDLLTVEGRAVTRTPVVEQRTRTVGEWADAVEAGFISTIQLIDDSELRAGLARFREAHPEPTAPLVYELRFDRIVVRL